MAAQRSTLGRGPPQGPPTLSRRTITTTTMVCFLAWVFSVYDFVLFGTLLPKISETFGWSTGQATAIATGVTVGTFVVSLLVGPMLDRWGRKPSLIVTTAGAALSSGLTALVGGAGSLIGARAISGLGYSEEVVNGVYLNEMYGKSRRRGFMFSLVQSGWPVGALLAAAFAAVLLPIMSWRWIFLLATFPVIVILIAGSKLRESPSFVALKRTRELRKDGRDAEAARLAKLYDLDISRDNESGLRQLFAPDPAAHPVPVRSVAVQLDGHPGLLGAGHHHPHRRQGRLVLQRTGRADPGQHGRLPRLPLPRVPR